MTFQRLLLTLFCLCFYFCGKTQDFSNKGTEFWVGYGYHQSMSIDNMQDMVLYFTSDVAANVKVDIPALGWSKSYNVSPNSVVESDVMPKSGPQDARLLSDGVYKTGIHITSNQPIVAYAHIYNSSVSGASLLFPVATLGQDYYSLNFNQKANIDNSNSWAYVVATEDTTSVEITPSANTLNHAAGQPFVVTLNKGEIYNLMGTTNGDNGVDLTGTRIRSISTGLTGCKKIAVFSGSGRLSINCDNAISSSDNVIQQVFPRTAWGRKYLTVPTAELPNNFFRIAVSDPSTKVTVDGTPLSNLTNGFYYEITANTPKLILADKPVMVSQYITSANIPTCGNSSNNGGDPEMIYLSPIEQTIDKITLNSTNHYKITAHYINVIIKSSAVNSFTLDGTKVLSFFTPHPQDAAYSYAVFKVENGAHNLKADSGFNAIAYGYGILESYGYNAGTNIKDLYQYLTLRNQYTTVNFPTTCTGTKFQLAITLPFKASSLSWDFGGNTHISPNHNITNNSPKVDSSYVTDGRTLYVYRLPSLYSFDAVGTYPLKIVANNQTSDGCNGMEEIKYNVTVVPPPSTDFTITQTGCATDSVLFSDASAGNGRNLEKWFWKFPDGTIDSVKNVSHSFPGPGTYNVTHTSINDIGCAIDATKTVSIAPPPVANFGISNKTCVNTWLTFTDSSTASSGSIAKWTWHFSDGSDIIATTKSPVTNYYSSVGSYSVTLTVENSSGCKSAPVTKTFTVHANPTVNFNAPGVACLPAAAINFTNLSTIIDGRESPLTFVWKFGDGQTSTVKNPQHTYITPGPFNVNLTATSVYGCSADSTKVISNIYDRPKANFSYSPTKICDVDTLNFTDESTAVNSLVSNWFWTFGDGGKSTAQNPVNKYAESGSYNVSLFVKSSVGCNSDTITKTVRVNKSPTAAFDITGASCEKETFSITDRSKANSGSVVSWIWDFGNGTNETRTNGKPFNKSYDKAGTYTILLIVETDNGCKSDTASKTAMVQPLPVANFILPETCVADPYTAFTDSSYTPGAASTLSYKWNFGDANATATNPNTSTAQNPTHKYTKAGFYTVALTTTTAAGCSATTSKQLSVNSLPKTNFEVTTTSAICSNAAIQIKNNSTIDVGSITRIDLVWDANNNPSVVETDYSAFTGKTYSHTYPNPPTSKTYTIRMVAYSGTTCSDEKTVSVIVNPSPKVTFGQIPAMCISDSAITITQAQETTGLAGTFVFTGNGVSPTGVFNPAISGAGQIPVTYIYTSTAGCSASATQAINVVPNPAIQLPPQYTILENGSAMLDPSINGNVVKYSWSPATYLSNPSVRNPESTPPDSIMYHLSVTTVEGCSGSANTLVAVIRSLQVPNAFSPNGDGINDFWNVPALASFPNCTVDVFNRYGTPVFTSVGYSRPWDGTFKGSALPVGVYYYIINLHHGKKPYTGYVTILK
jgi:gliding motility-associated-like protein